MKKTLTLCIFVLLYSATYAQIPGKMTFELMQMIRNSKELSTEISVLVKGDLTEIEGLTKRLGGTYKFGLGEIASIRIPIGKLNELATGPHIFKIESHVAKYQVLNDSMVIHNRVIQVNQGNAPLLQGYDGTGVVMGFIDTGIDFSHPDFKDALGHSRIKWLWDHRSVNGPNTPQPYNYGQQFSNTDIDAGSCTSFDLLNSSHGTNVAGIGAGNGLAIGHYAGVAPGADIIEVAFDFSSTAPNRFADAVKYIYDKADSMGKPCVINISAGDFFGSHDGRDPEAQLIKNLITAHPGRSLVSAAGNWGWIPLHSGYNISNTDTNFTWYNNAAQIYIQIWADTNNFNNARFGIGADRTIGSFEYRGGTPLGGVASRFQVLQNEDITNGNGQHIANVQSYCDTMYGDYLLEYMITPDSMTYNYRFMTSGSGHFDIWSNDIVRSGLPDAVTYPAMTHYKYSDSVSTLANSFNCLDEVISVGSYANRNIYTAFDGNPHSDLTFVPGSLALNSSKGPTRDGRQKPDISATGIWLLSSTVLSEVAAVEASAQPWRIALGDKHSLCSGTSMSSPVVAGTAALYLQQNPNATWQDIKNCITQTAMTDAFTGPQGNLPDYGWGYGKLDAFQTMICGMSVGAKANQPTTINAYNYPNPFNESTTIHIDVTGSSKHDQSQIQIYDVTGQLAGNYFMGENDRELKIAKGTLSPGIYICRWLVGGKCLKSWKMGVL